MSVTRWVNVAVAMQSALGSNLTISAITLANPGVVSSTAHGLNDGDYVVLTITGGMQQLNGRVVRVDNKTSDTFELEGIDTSTFDAFTAGYANKITFGTTFATLMDAAPSGGDQQFITYRLLHDDQEQQIPSVKSAQVYTFRSLWDPSDAALAAAQVASDAAAERAIRFTFSNAKKFVFNGYVGFTSQPQGTAGELVEATLTVTGKGRGTPYAT